LRHYLVRSKLRTDAMRVRLTTGSVACPALSAAAAACTYGRYVALADFSADGSGRVLVATDVAARGLDVADIALVVRARFFLQSGSEAHHCDWKFAHATPVLVQQMSGEQHPGRSTTICPWRRATPASSSTCTASVAQAAHRAPQGWQSAISTQRPIKPARHAWRGWCRRLGSRSRLSCTRWRRKRSRQADRPGCCAGWLNL
jgi:hypothetical protein